MATGDRIYVNGSGLITGNPVTAPAETGFTGATDSVDGTRGQVPKPTTGQEDFHLRGDGSWKAPASSGTYEVVTHYLSVAALGGVDNFTHTTDANTVQLRVTVVGGGGSSGGSPASTSVRVVGGAGGGGGQELLVTAAYFDMVRASTHDAVNNATPYVFHIQVGAGAPAAVSGSYNGFSGQQSRFGTFRGAGGTYAHGLNGSQVASDNGGSGGGTGTNAPTTDTPQEQEDYTVVVHSETGGRGGTSWGNKSADEQTILSAGGGGGTLLGAKGGDLTRIYGNANNQTGVPGYAGASIGGGGAGYAINHTSTARTGISGKDGIVIVIETRFIT